MGALFPVFISVTSTHKMLEASYGWHKKFDFPIIELSHAGIVLEK
jgi:hypothetical protein